jgi:hypothetical protein
MMPASPRSSRLPTVASLAGVFGVALLLRVPIADIPLERDEGEYAYIAQRWLQGEIPYRDNFDQKPPGAFLAYLVFLRVFGSSPAALHWGAQVYSLGTLVFLFFLGRHLLSVQAGTVAALFYAVMAADPVVFGNAANTEVLLVLPMAGAAFGTVAAVERDSVAWAFVTGIAGAASVLCKQIAAFPLAFLLLWLLLRGQRRWVLAGAVVAGGIALTVPVVGYFALHGAWREFYDCVIGYNLTYTADIPWSHYPRRFWPVSRGLVVSFWPVYLLAGLAAVNAFLGAWLRGTRQRHRAFLFLLGWLGATFLGAATGGHFFPHYFIPTFLPIALLAGAGLVGLTATIRSPSMRAVAPVAIAGGVVLATVLLKPQYYLTWGGEAKCRGIYGGHNLFGQAPAVARFLASQSGPGETVFILGSEPQIYYYAERKCASRYIFVYPLMSSTNYEDTLRRQQEVMRELRENDPEWVLTVFIPNSLGDLFLMPPDLFEGIRSLLAESYTPAAVIPFQDGEHQPLLTGEAALRFCQEKPMWYDRWYDPATRWSSLIIWRKVRSTP